MMLTNLKAKKRITKSRGIMPWRQHQRSNLATSAVLMIASLLIEAFSKSILLSRFGALANDPLHLAVNIRDAEGWLYLAVICAVIGTAINAFVTGGNDKRFWWYRGAVLIVLVLWPLLALLYLFVLPYPIVGIGYALCFGILLITQLRKSDSISETKKSEGAAEKPTTADEP